MRITVDRDRCQSHGQCEYAAPEVFRINDDGDLDVLDPEPPDTQHDLVRQAVQNCPTGALTVSAD
jgi:ferredoxin